jgi:hypothetical protein
VTPTPQTLAFQIVVNIYNSAGEVVRTLYNGPSQSQAGGFTISGDLLMSGSSSVTLSFPGVLSNGQNSLIWSGLNDGLQPVSGGIYLIKVQQKDSFGDITSWTQAVNVLPPPASEALKIFNSAGELVDSIDLSSYGQVNDFALQSSNSNQNSYVISSDGSQGGVTFLLKQQTSNTPMTWNGLNGQGQEVASGTYMAELVTTAPGGASVVDSKSFTLLDTEGSTPKIIEGPNPVGPKDTVIVLNYGALTSGEFGSLKLYDLAGQLVATASAPSGSQSLSMAIGHWAPGIYIGVFEVRMGGGVVSRQFLHIAMER